jgi:hypothetical protein
MHTVTCKKVGQQLPVHVQVWLVQQGPVSRLLHGGQHGCAARLVQQRTSAGPASLLPMSASPSCRPPLQVPPRRTASTSTRSPERSNRVNITGRRGSRGRGSCRRQPCRLPPCRTGSSRPCRVARRCETCTRMCIHADIPASNHTPHKPGRCKLQADMTPKCRNLTQQLVAAHASTKSVRVCDLALRLSR